MSDKTRENSTIIGDAINSLWGGRIIGGLFLLIGIWAISSKIIEGLQ